MIHFFNSVHFLYNTDTPISSYSHFSIQLESGKCNKLPPYNAPNIDYLFESYLTMTYLYLNSFYTNSYILYFIPIKFELPPVKIIFFKHLSLFSSSENTRHNLINFCNPCYSEVINYGLNNISGQFCTDNSLKSFSR